MVTKLGDLPMESLGQDLQILEQQGSAKKVNRALFTDDGEQEDYDWHRY